jgi:hypothetical protein
MPTLVIALAAVVLGTNVGVRPQKECPALTC